MAETIWRHYAEPHWPRFYRFQVAERGLRVARNRYAFSPAARGTVWIGMSLVVGRHAYCVNWAYARLRREGDRG
jgi:hypothetical protein